MAAALMHRGLEQAADRFGDRDAVLAGDDRWTFAETRRPRQRLRPPPRRTRRRSRRPGGGDDVQPRRVRASRSTPSASWVRAAVLLSPAWKAVEVDHAIALTAPVHAVADGESATLLARAPGPRPRHRSRRRLGGRGSGVGQPRRVRPSRRCARHRRGGARVQLGHDRVCRRPCATRTARSATPRCTGAQALGLGPDDRFQVATPPSHILGLLNLLAAAPAGRHRAAAPPVRPRRGAPPHRVRSHDPRDGGRADRAGDGQPPAPRGLRPLVAALHHVGRDAGERERGPTSSPSAPASGGCRPTAPASCR